MLVDHDQTFLKSLQDELIAFKAAHPSLRVQKAPHDSPDYPFPLVVSATIAAPPEGSHIDIDFLPLRLTLSLPNANASNAVVVAIDITSESIPGILRDAIASEIRQRYASAFRKTNNSTAVIGLADVFYVVVSNWVQLLSLVPRCLERYEATGQDGRTVRRVAIINPEGTVENMRPPEGFADELERIRRRYVCEIIQPSAKEDNFIDPFSSLKMAEDTSSATAMRLTATITPTDPNWHATLHGVHLTLKCTVAANYPGTDSFQVALFESPFAEKLTADERTAFNAMLQAEAVACHGCLDPLRRVLRQCENRAGELLHQAREISAEVQQRRQDLIRSLAQRQVFPPIGSREGPSADNSCPSVTSDKDQVGSGVKGESSPLLECSSMLSRAHFAFAHAGSFRLQLHDLQLDDVEALMAVDLTLQVRCNRCEALIDTCFASIGSQTLETSYQCATCNSPLAMRLAPRVVYDSSNVLAVVNGTGCSPVDLLPSTLSGQCSQCSSLVAFRSVQVGRWNERTCSHCIRRLAFYMSSVRFTHIRAPPDDSRVPSALKTKQQHGNKHKGSSVITPGQPLPDNGACRHYRHSYRWLRFPCCGRRFPCDLCHEEGTDGHEMKWAHRMVCGFCSVEQDVAERCRDCGRRLATTAKQPGGRNSAFWEGGQGQRDHKKLSKNDPHKWTGSKFKTKSRKDVRVGQKGKERVAKAKDGGT